VFFLVATLLPYSSKAGSDRVHLGQASLYLRLGETVLYSTALLLPLLTLPFRRRNREIGLGTGRGVLLGCVLSHALVLLGLASMLSILSLAVMTMTTGFPDSGRKPFLLTERLLQIPASGVRLQSGPETWDIPIPPAVRDRVTGLQLKPTLSLTGESFVRGALRCKGVVILMDEASRILKRIPFEADRGRRVHLDLVSALAAEGIASQIRRIATIGVQCIDDGKELRFAPDSIAILGGMRPLIPTMIRGFLLAAIKALCLVILVHGFLTWTRFPIAVLAASVMSLALATVGPLGEWIPRTADAIASGFAQGYEPLLFGILAAGAALGAALLFANFAIRVSEGRG
jgi:hypothetical protein